MSTRIMTLNAKGHPTVGHLAPKKRVSPQKYASLNAVALAIHNLVEDDIMKDIYDEANFNAVYQQIYDYVDLDMEPTFDDIDDMLMIASALFEFDKHKDLYAEFIMNCPKRFIMAYANNSETIPAVLNSINKRQLYSVYRYLVEHIHESKLKTLNERRDVHKRDNILLECSVFN